MATYVNDLRLKEIATGDESGTWGTSTNTNLELIAEAFSFGTEAITTNADTHDTTIADGSTDPGRSIYLKYTGTLDSTCTITIGPNTVSKLWLIENGTSGLQDIIISQGSGANVTIPAGHVKAIYSDGAGSGAAMVNAFTNLNLGGTTTVDDLTISDDLTVTDDMTIGGTLGVTGVVTANAGVVVDNITIDGTEIDLSSGDLTLDSAGDIILDADGADILLKDAGTTFGELTNSSTDFVIKSTTSNKDILFKGNDAGSAITALTLDMSDAGTAIFNHDMKLADNSKLLLGDDLNGVIQVSSSTKNLKITNLADDADIDIRSDDGSGGDAVYFRADGSTGAAKMYHLGSEKIATTSSGAEVTGTLAATLSTAAQPNITSVGTLTSFRSTGIDDNADALAITIDSSERVGIGTSSPSQKLEIHGAIRFGDTVSDVADGGRPLIYASDGSGSHTGHALVIQARDGAGSEIDFVTGTTPTTRMHIDSSGRVGIGTTSPNQKLNVSGGRSYFGANGEAFAIGLGFNGTRTASNQTYFLGATDSATPDLQISNADGGEKVRITHAGNLLVGSTTDHEGKVQIAATNEAGLFVRDSSTSNAAPYLRVQGQRSDGNTSESFSGGLVLEGYHTSDKVGDGKALGTIYFGGNHTNGTESNISYAASITGIAEGAFNSATDMPTCLAFLTGDAGTALKTANSDFGTERMRIASSGKVGIGNTSPLGKLTISNAAGTNAPTTVAAANTYLQLGSDDFGASSNGKFMIGFGYTDATNTNSPAYIGFEETSSSGDTKGELTFYTRDVITDTAPTERMRIDDSGNVGIGTTSPSTNNAQLVSFKDGGSFAYLGHNNSGGTFPKVSALSFGSSAVSFTHTTNGGTNALTGSAQIAAIQSASSNAVTDMAFYTTSGGSVAERMRIDSSGNVGLGTSAPDVEFHVMRSSSSPSYNYPSRYVAAFERNGACDVGIRSNSSNASSLSFSDENDADVGRISYAHSDNSLRITVNAAEAMRIDSGGNAFFNRTGQIGTHRMSVNFASGSSEKGMGINSSDAGATTHMTFLVEAVAKGSISTDGSTTTYNTSSDARLKDVTGEARGLEVVNKLNPVSYNWKKTGISDEGLIAQELEGIVPNAIVQDDDGYYQMDYSKLVTHLVKAVQEQQEQIESLTSEIAILKEK